VPTLLAIPYAFGYVNRFRAYEIARVKRFPAPQLLKTKSSKKLYAEVPEKLMTSKAFGYASNLLLMKSFGSNEFSRSSCGSAYATRNLICV